MSYVFRKVEELRANGIYSAEKVREDVIHKIINMEEWEYLDIEIGTLESYLGVLAQQIKFIRQECNIAEAREIELGNDFKMSALPYVINSKIRSVEERWLFAATIEEQRELRMKFDLWQRALIDATLLNEQADPLIEKLNVLKRLYDDRRMNGKDGHVNRYLNGS